jgi:hypothetical protein
MPQSDEVSAEKEQIDKWYHLVDTTELGRLIENFGTDYSSWNKDTVVVKLKFFADLSAFFLQTALGKLPKLELTSSGAIDNALWEYKWKVADALKNTAKEIENGK